LLKIEVCKKNIAEKSYALDVIFRHFLGLEYEITEKATGNYKISFNERHIEVYDSFQDDEIYSFPKPIVVDDDSYTPLYGDSTIEETSRYVKLNGDIFASAFFMLSRWEERNCQNKDQFNRFSASDSFVFRNNLLHRPLVNEYVEVLWSFLRKLRFDKKRLSKEFKIIPTHDVDAVKQTSFIRRFLGDIIKRRDLKSAFTTLKNAFVNEYDMFDWLMDVSENNGLKSRFYFMAADKSEFDDGYDIRSQKSLVNRIIKRGHIVGFHPGFYTYNNTDNFNKEKTRLENVLGETVLEGRQHYLRFEVPGTWKMWNNNGMKVDSTMGYADHEGFRCGTSDEYPVFDVESRKPLDLLERPLVVMEGTLLLYRNLSREESCKQLDYYKRVCRKYKMPYTILFHNTSFTASKWRGWKKVYSDLVQA